MPYTKNAWVDDSTPDIDATNLNHMEAGIAAAPYGPDGSSGFVPVGDGSGAWVYKKITNAEIDAAAAIAYAQLVLTGSVVNADIAVAAAIALSKIADPGTGKVLGSDGAGHATSVNPPGYEFGYDQIVSPVVTASTTEASGTTVISCAAHTFDGSPVIALFFAPYIDSGTSSGNTMRVCLFESTTEIGRLCEVNNTSAFNQRAPGVGAIRFTPTAGVHTYTVTCYSGTANSGTPGVGAGSGGTGAYVPAFIRFIKV